MQLDEKKNVENVQKNHLISGNERRCLLHIQLLVSVLSLYNPWPGNYKYNTQQILFTWVKTNTTVCTSSRHKKQISVSACVLLSCYWVGINGAVMDSIPVRQTRPVISNKAPPSTPTTTLLSLTSKAYLFNEHNSFVWSFLGGICWHVV